MNQDVQGVSCTISGWLEDVRRLLQSVQFVLENSSPAKGAPPEVRAMFDTLAPMIRQCRSQIPTDRMVEVWVREVAASRVRIRRQPEATDRSRVRGRPERISA